MIKRKRLIGFTDTKIEAEKKKKMLGKMGYGNISINKKYGGFEVFGKKVKRK